MIAVPDNIRKVAVNALYDARNDDKVMDVAAVEVAAAVMGELLTPDEAKNLAAAYMGGAVDAALLDSATPKLEALAGEEFG